MKICSEQAQWRRQGSEVGGWQSWLVRSPPPLPPIPLPLLFVPSPLSLLSEIFPLLFFSPVFLPKIQLGVWGSAEGSPSGAPAAKAFLPYFETRIRSGCNDFGSFCTDQNIHLNQDRSYWLLPRYTSYDYFSSDLCWSQDRSWRGLGAVAPVCPPPRGDATEQAEQVYGDWRAENRCCFRSTHRVIILTCEHSQRVSTVCQAHLLSHSSSSTLQLNVTSTCW